MLKSLQDKLNILIESILAMDEALEASRAQRPFKPSDIIFSSKGRDCLRLIVHSDGTFWVTDSVIEDTANGEEIPDKFHCLHRSIFSLKSPDDLDDALRVAEKVITTSEPIYLNNVTGSIVDELAELNKDPEEI
jgi:hypothetical protein